jgi:hypothetical protein
VKFKSSLGLLQLFVVDIGGKSLENPDELKVRRELHDGEHPALPRGSESHKEREKL